MLYPLCRNAWTLLQSFKLEIMLWMEQNFNTKKPSGGQLFNIQITLFQVGERLFFTNDGKLRKYFFSILNIKPKIIFLKNDCSQLSFEVYYVFVAQKLKILENVKHFFLAWTLVTSATSRGPNFDLSNLNRVSNFSWRCQFSYEILFVDKNENCGGVVNLNFYPRAGFI